jgi:hypothetical protein
MEITETACPGCTRDAVLTPTAYRVVLWEQPEVEGVHPESIGWGEAAFDLRGIADVREALRWAEEQLAAGAGAYSRARRPTRDREYVVYANIEVLGEQALVLVAGRDPTRGRGNPTQVVLKPRN